MIFLKRKNLTNLHAVTPATGQAAASTKGRYSGTGIRYFRSTITYSENVPASGIPPIIVNLLLGYQRMTLTCELDPSMYRDSGPLESDSHPRMGINMTFCRSSESSGSEDAMTIPRFVKDVSGSQISLRGQW